MKVETGRQAEDLLRKGQQKGGFWKSLGGRDSGPQTMFSILEAESRPIWDRVRSEEEKGGPAPLDVDVESAPHPGPPAETLPAVGGLVGPTRRPTHPTSPKGTVGGGGSHPVHAEKPPSTKPKLVQ
ncbi:hypothetical protein GWK47_052304 [Chionoecetes opilio]|uniref:Uncharacterized protein n=1 Tax=Chionoecetes opilio TaxID=41210 RepID=A0A8J5CQ74_CHIOP|nr:hypothetical protein GWK47_052304 [Chionoecetes opilio]